MRAAPARTASSTLSWLDVRGNDNGAPLDEKSNDLPAHLSRAEHQHRPSLEAGSPAAGRRRLHRNDHAESGGGTGIAGSAAGRRRAPHERCRLLNQIHVVLRRPDILCGDVAPLQAVDGGGKVAQEGRRLHEARVPDDDRLPTPMGQSGQSCLCRHGSREAEDVVERQRLVPVRVEPRTAERRAEESGVDGDDGAQTARRPARDDDVLVLGPGEPFQHPVRIRHGLATHDRILRGIGDDGTEAPLAADPVYGRGRRVLKNVGASTVKAIVDTAASLFSRPTSVTSTCSTKFDGPCRTIQASARAGPTTTGDRK